VPSRRRGGAGQGTTTACCGMPDTSDSSGVTMMPPPIPSSPDKKPAQLPATRAPRSVAHASRALGASTQHTRQTALGVGWARLRSAHRRAHGSTREHTCEHQGERVGSLTLAARHRHDARRQVPARLGAHRRNIARRGTRRQALLGAFGKQAGGRASSQQRAPAPLMLARCRLPSPPLALPSPTHTQKAGAGGGGGDASRSGTVGATSTRNKPMRRFSAA
jgi:hypothetical protein